LCDLRLKLGANLFRNRANSKLPCAGRFGELAYLCSRICVLNMVSMAGIGKRRQQGTHRAQSSSMLLICRNRPNVEQHAFQDERRRRATEPILGQNRPRSSQLLEQPLATGCIEEDATIEGVNETFCRSNEEMTRHADAM
jgi:hypothetical protein